MTSPTSKPKHHSRKKKVGGGGGGGGGAVAATAATTQRKLLYWYFWIWLGLYLLGSYGVMTWFSLYNPTFRLSSTMDQSLATVPHQQDHRHLKKQQQKQQQQQQQPKRPQQQANVIQGKKQNNTAHRVDNKQKQEPHKKNAPQKENLLKAKNKNNNNKNTQQKREGKRRSQHNMTKIESCLKTRNRPKPVILLSAGRSGSTAIWQLLGNLTGEETEDNEYTGSIFSKSEAFFADKEGYSWMTDYLCEQQRRHKKAGIIGFKWKPFRSIYYPPAQEALQSVRGLRIKVIRNRRNELDMLLSLAKHEKMKEVLFQFRPIHCVTGELICVLPALQYSKNITLNTTTLLQDLDHERRMKKKLDRMLKKLDVPVVHVSYEKLFYATTELAEEWMRIFRFLGVGPASNLTTRHVRDSTLLAPTSVRDHRISIQNYDEVAALLKGTEFAELLRDGDRQAFPPPKGKRRANAKPKAKKE